MAVETGCLGQRRLADPFAYVGIAAEVMAQEGDGGRRNQEAARMTMPLGLISLRSFGLPRLRFGPQPRHGGVYTASGRWLCGARLCAA